MSTQLSEIEINKYYKEIYIKCGKVMESSLDSISLSDFSRNHNFILDLECWANNLSKRFEVNHFRFAIREYLMALMSLLIGHYRQSFIALRQFLEMSSAIIYFSANEFEFRRWLRNEQDITWRSLTDANKGVFSTNFVKVFFEDLQNYASQYSAIADKIYRECSEFVHGNASIQDFINNDLVFDENLFKQWNEKAKSMRMVISFALTCRYAKTLEIDQLKELEPIILDEMGHIEEVRTLF